MGLSTSYSRHCFLPSRSLIRGYLVIYSGKRERREGSEEGNFAFPWPFRSALVSNIRTTMKKPAVFLHAPLPRHYAVLFSPVCGLFLLRVVSWFPYSLFHQRWHSHLQKLDEPLYLPILRRKVSHTLHKPKKNHQFTLQENIVIITYPCILLSSFPHKGPIWVGNADLT